MKQLQVDLTFIVDSSNRVSEIYIVPSNVPIVVTEIELLNLSV